MCRLLFLVNKINKIMQKLGLFGGSFNPPHNGHVHIAQAFVDELQLDNVIFLPAGNPYHKSSLHIDAEHRWQMTQYIIELDSRFAASDVDLNRAGATYTIDTINIFRQFYPQAELWWLMGMDSLMTLHTWKHWQTLVRQVNIAVAARAGQMLTQLPHALHDYVGNALQTGSLYFLNAPMLDISSTQIRAALAQQQDVSAWLPKTVADYVQQQKLYQNPNTAA
ncbi:putative nicotinate-nucleotide adenylyltransferase [Kingella kingae PYKK081]|nr:putative nicotinate-nucleotide adenylyltransferase [Kingella kingae PYKK081]